MEFRRVSADKDSLLAYRELMRLCFPKATKFSESYFKWLYLDNPDGGVVGFDAWDKDQLAAHYVCVPTSAVVGARKARLLLSLNTATHPRYQGKGLFTRLAEMTYEMAASEGFDAVYGVANANSTPGFIRKLGFQLVQPLEARLGIGSLDVDFAASHRASQFERAWTPETLSWRCANPNNPIFRRSHDFGFQFYASAIGGFIQAYAELPGSVMADMESGDAGRNIASPCHLFLGLYPASTCMYRKYINIPHRFRPSPLNFIYRSLSHRVEKLEKDSISLSFLDFDAY